MERLLIKRGVDYTIINASADNVTQIEKARDIIEYNDKTITLSCGRFNTGVTVPEWDLVMMLDDTRAPETYFQTVFRCQSPDQNRLKDECYVVDFNPQRNLELIYEFADITAKKGQSTQAAVREFLEFAPVLDHSGNKPVLTDTNAVLKMIAETGSYAERFGSAFMLNWNHLDQVAETFNGVSPDANAIIAQEINDNDIVKGKNYAPTAAIKTKTPSALKEERELRQRVITTMRRLPKYLYVEETTIDNLDDIVHNNNNQLFFEAVGIDLTDFKELIDTKFIKKDRLDRAIMAFNQIREL